MIHKSTFSSVIRNRGFKFLWLNQLLLQLSYNTLNFALIIWVFKLTGSNFAVSLVLLAVYLPSFLFGLVAGVLVDKVDRRKLILYLDMLFALSFVLFAVGKDSYLLILVNTFFINTLAQFFMPTESSAIPLVVPKKQLFFANSLFSLTLYGSFMVGFSIAGPILNFSNDINAIFMLGFVAMVCAWMFALNLPKITSGRSKRMRELLAPNNLQRLMKVTFSESKKTLSFIHSKVNIVVAIGLLASIQGIIGILGVLISSYMERVLRIQATDASYVLMVPLGLGMMFGAFIIGKFAQNLPRRSIVRPAILICGSIFFLMGIVPYLSSMFPLADLPMRIVGLRFFSAVPALSLLFAFGAFTLGMCTVSVIIPAQTVLQENTTARNRGKIFAVLLVLMNAVAVVPVILVGALSDLFGVSPIFTVMGIIIFGIGMLALTPATFFEEKALPYRLREFLGLGHWQRV